MLEVSFFGFKYARLIASNGTMERPPEELKKKFSYVQIQSYTQLLMPGFVELKKNAIIINLAPSLEEISKTFRDTTRNEINRTYKIDDLQFIVGDSNFQPLHFLHRSFDIKRGWMPAPQEELEKSLIFSAYYKGKPVSIITCFHNDTVLRVLELFSARYDSTKEENAIIGYATRRLIYEICKYGKEHGYIKLDLGGVNLDDSAKAGITRFKQSFNGSLVDVYTYLYSTHAFNMFKKMLKVFKIDISS